MNHFGTMINSNSSKSNSFIYQIDKAFCQIKIYDEITHLEDYKFNHIIRKKNHRWLKMDINQRYFFNQYFWIP